MRHIGKKERNANKCIAAIMQFRNDDATVAFAADNGIYFFHPAYYIYFTHSAGEIFTAMFGSYIFQRTGRRHVADGITFLMLQYIICHGNKRIFFAKEGAIFTNKTKAVHIRVYSYAEVCMLLIYFIAKLV